MTSPDSVLHSLEEVTLATVNPFLCLWSNFILPHSYFILSGWLLTDFFKKLIFFLKFLRDQPTPPYLNIWKYSWSKPGLEVEPRPSWSQCPQDCTGPCCLQSVGSVSACSSTSWQWDVSTAFPSKDCSPVSTGCQVRHRGHRASHSPTNCQSRRRNSDGMQSQVEVGCRGNAWARCHNADLGSSGAGVG